MNRRIILITIIVAVLLTIIGIGFVYKYYLNNRKVNLVSTMTSIKSSVCIFTKTNSNVELLTSGYKTRTKTVENGIVNHYINDGMSVYQWVEGDLTGFRISNLPSPVPVDPKQIEDFATVNNSYWIDNGYQIDCRFVSIPDSAFIPPTDVAFREVEKEIPELEI